VLVSDKRFEVSESTGEITEPFDGSVIGTIDTNGLSDDQIKSAILDYAVSVYPENPERAMKTIGLLAAENIDRVDLER